MKHRGVALIWTLILSTVLIIISTTMVSYIIKDSQFSVRIEESTQVYAAARSGIDWAKWKIDTKRPTDSLSDAKFFFFPDEVKNFPGIETDVSFASLTGGGYEVTSAASSNGVMRKLKYKVIPNAGSLIVPKPAVNDTYIGNNRESFTTQFDFWVPESNIGAVSFGVRNSTSTSKIYLSVNENFKAQLGTTISGVTNLSSSTIDLGSDRSKPYNYRVTIKYVKDAGARLIISKNNFDTSGTFTCLGSINTDLTAKDFGDLSNLYAFANNGAVSYATGTNYGDYIALTNSTGSKTWVAVDNVIIKK